MPDASSTNEYTLAALGPDTWDAFRDLVERHNGIFGGCWCTWFHTLKSEKTFEADDNRLLKQRLVAEERAHGALVLDGDRAIACGSTAPRRSFRTSTTARSTTRRAGGRPTTGSPASSSTAHTDIAACPASPSVAHST